MSLSDWFCSDVPWLPVLSVDSFLTGDIILYCDRAEEVKPSLWSVMMWFFSAALVGNCLRHMWHCSVGDNSVWLASSPSDWLLAFSSFTCVDKAYLPEYTSPVSSCSLDLFVRAFIRSWCCTLEVVTGKEKALVSGGNRNPGKLGMVVRKLSKWGRPHENELVGGNTGWSAMTTNKEAIKDTIFFLSWLLCSVVRLTDKLHCLFYHVQLQLSDKDVPRFHLKVQKWWCNACGDNIHTCIDMFLDVTQIYFIIFTHCGCCFWSILWFSTIVSWT